MDDKWDISKSGKKEKIVENDYGFRIHRWDNSYRNKPYETDHIRFPTQPFPFHELDSNITFGELQSKSFEEILEWIKLVRLELFKRWVVGEPPYVGKQPHVVKSQFDELKDYPIDKFFIKDELYPDYIGFIKNFSKIASGVNQFFRGILESRINGKSIYDYLRKEELSEEFKYTIVQKVRFDKMFMYSNYLSDDTMKFKDNRYIPSEDYFMYFYKHFISNTQREGFNREHQHIAWGNKIYDDFEWRHFPVDVDKGPIGFWFEDYNFNKQNDKKNRIGLSSSFVKEFLKTNPVGFLGDNRQGFNVEGDEEYFAVRWYYEDRLVFPELFQILRVGLNQVAVNFPPLTARYLYEEFLPRKQTQSKYKVYDACAGWGGRLLGSLCSNLPIHYIGTEVNDKNYHCYDELEGFYKGVIVPEVLEESVIERPFRNDVEGGNTQEVWFEGSEVIHQNKVFWDKHKDTIDLCFTSPPYFNKEQYSEDKEQSFLKYPNYDDWLDGYLEQTLQNCFDLLKSERYCLINICDIKDGNNLIPLEQDTVRRAIKVGFEYVGKYGMLMSRMIGLNPTNSKNYYLDTENHTTYKTEPILVFKKQI